MSRRMQRRWAPGAFYTRDRSGRKNRYGRHWLWWM